MKSKLIQIVLLGLTLGSTGLRVLAQGQLFLSNIGEPPSGYVAVGADSLIAAPFFTGNDLRGYFLHSIQLLMNGPTGSPNNLSLSIHQVSRAGGPGTLVGQLTGPAPSEAGIFTFTPASSIPLSPLTIYRLKLSGDTPVAIGSFSWDVTSSPSFESEQGWRPGTGYDYSADGIDWNVATSTRLQFAINATIVPEPSSLALCLTAGIIAVSRRARRARSPISAINSAGPL
jgi:hypothetical protein